MAPNGLRILQLLALIALSVASCPGCNLFDPDESLRRQLIGSWRYSDDVASCTISFRSDGTCSLTTGGTLLGNLMRLVNGDLRGTWYVKDESCYVEYESADGPLGGIGLMLVQAVEGKALFVMNITSIDSHKIKTIEGFTYYRIAD